MLKHKIPGGRRKSRKPQKWEDYVADEEQLETIDKELENEEIARRKQIHDDITANIKEEAEMSEDEQYLQIDLNGEVDAAVANTPLEKEKCDERGIPVKMCKVCGNEIKKAHRIVSVGRKRFKNINRALGEKGNGLSVLPKDLLHATCWKMFKLPLRNKKRLKKQPEARTSQQCKNEPGNHTESEKDTASEAAAITDCNKPLLAECTTCSIHLRGWDTIASHLKFHRVSYIPSCLYEILAPFTKRKMCQVCGRNYLNHDVLAYHAYTVHYRSHKHSKICPFCGISFRVLVDLQEHLDIDLITFECPMCSTSVQQEHKFFQHLVSCTKERNQGATKVSCSICATRISSDKLKNHLQEHSTLLRPKSAMSDCEPGPPLMREQSNHCPFLCEACDHRFVGYGEFKRHLYWHFKAKSYVCTHCGRSYCQKNTLIVHLYSYHNESPKADEITPKEDTTQSIFCELCGRCGFSNTELLVRHYILRCSKRNNMQLSFAVIISSLAKSQNQNFIEAVRSKAMSTYYKLGQETWKTPSLVHDYLADLQSSSKEQPSPPTSRREAAEFTDVQLLEYLDKFDETYSDTDKALDFLLNFRNKSGKEKHLDEVLQSHEKMSPAPATSTEREGSQDDGQDARMSTCHPLNLSFSATSHNNSKIDIDRLMQHLNKNKDQIKAEGENGEGPIDICFVTSTTNTQVTITPAGQQKQLNSKPPKIARVVKHKPSVAEIQCLYPGVTVLGDIDFSRVPSLVLEMQQMMDTRLQRAMENSSIKPADLQRLEMEAQLLREAEPFYVEEDHLLWRPQCRTEADPSRRPSKQIKEKPHPEILASILNQAKDLCKQEDLFLDISSDILPPRIGIRF